MKSFNIRVDVDSVYVDRRGHICANIQIKFPHNQLRSSVIDITSIFEKEPPK